MSKPSAKSKYKPPPPHGVSEGGGRKDHLFSTNLLGHDRIIIPFPSIGSFFPSSCAETPLATGFKTDTAQIIAAGGRKIQKFACEEA